MCSIAHRRLSILDNQREFSMTVSLGLSITQVCVKVVKKEQGPVVGAFDSVYMHLNRFQSTSGRDLFSMVLNRTPPLFLNWR